VYGLFSTALDFKNLIPGVTMALGVSAVPAISSACEVKDNDRAAILINSVYKYTSLLGLLGGLMLGAFGGDILSLFYGGSADDIVALCEPLVKYFGFTAVLYSLAGTAVFVVQAVGYPQKSIKPYIVSGIIRVILNIFLVKNESFILMGAVISGAVGYFVMWVWNVKIVCKYTKTRLKCFETIVKPLIVTIFTYFITRIIFLHISISVSLIYKLLIEIAILSFIFCILCFMCKVLNFREIFSTNKFKKNSINA
jgi:O-antigen/teichoic acid export membrane protein